MGNLRSSDFFDLGGVDAPPPGSEAGKWIQELVERRTPALNPEILADSRAEAPGQADTSRSLASNKSHHIKDFSRCHFSSELLCPEQLRAT